MKINLVSDMHLNFADIELPGGDVLIMAGDIMEAGILRRADNAGKDTFIADRFRRFIREELPKYKDVVYVMGNHEHYNNSYQDTKPRLEAELPHHVRLLENESVQIGDVHIYGATLWTDMNKGDPISLRVIEDGMSDFRCIKHSYGFQVKTAYGGSYYTSKFTPAYVKGVFHQSVENLKKWLAEREGEKCVVVTHHAPTELSIDPSYKDEYHMNGAYHSRLGDFIMDHPQIKVWCHGHVHNKTDYTMGECRVLANPRGYKGYEVIADNFDPSFSFEV